MNFFFDNAVSPKLVCSLRTLEMNSEDVFIHLLEDRRFEHSSPDEFIIGTIAKDSPKPVWLTADKSQATRGSAERLALRNSGLSVVFFAKGYGNLPIHLLASKIIAVWPEIRRAVSSCRVPTAFTVRINGSIEELFPTANM